jgi:hypothetical protein
MSPAFARRTSELFLFEGPEQLQRVIVVVRVVVRSIAPVFLR